MCAKQNPLYKVRQSSQSLKAVIPASILPHIYDTQTVASVLRMGANSWNKWMAQRSSLRLHDQKFAPHIDGDIVQLSELGDLTKFDFRNCLFKNQKIDLFIFPFSPGRLQGIRLPMNLDYCQWLNCDFTSGSFQLSNLEFNEFRGCNFTNCRIIDGQFGSMQFIDCCLKDCIIGGDDIDNVRFIRSKLADVLTSDASGSKWNFVENTLHSVTFQNISFPMLVFEANDLNNCRFDVAYLSHAYWFKNSWTNCSLESLSMRDASMAEERIFNTRFKLDDISNWLWQDGIQAVNCIFEANSGTSWANLRANWQVSDAPIFERTQFKESSISRIPIPKELIDLTK